MRPQPRHEISRQQTGFDVGFPSASQTLPGRNSELHARNIERVVRLMSGRFENTMSNDEMARVACFSPCHFNRLFRKLTGIPPVQFSYALRIARAKKLLMETDSCITDICFEVGYNSLGTFVSRFTKLVGLSPSAFRRLARGLETLRLRDLCSSLPAPVAEPRAIGGIVGRIDCEAPFDGLVFTALLRRAIPVAQPQACTWGEGLGPYALPAPPPGTWHALSVAVPWPAGGGRLLTFDGLSRGRSGCISVKNGRWSGDSVIRLAPPGILDPPILCVIPLLTAYCAPAQVVSPTPLASPSVHQNRH